MDTSGSAPEEAEEEVKKKISDSFFYDYMDMVSMPFVTPHSDIPLELIVLVYPLQLHIVYLAFQLLRSGVGKLQPHEPNLASHLFS